MVTSRALDVLRDGSAVYNRAPGLRVAIALDAICLALFVLLGRESHGLDSGLGWFVTVLWPFAAGWFVAAALLGAYSRKIRWRRVGLSLLLGVALALLLRVTLTGRAAPVAFVVVALVFNAFTILGWRVALTAWWQVRRR